MAGKLKTPEERGESRPGQRGVGSRPSGGPGSGLAQPVAKPAEGPANSADGCLSIMGQERGSWEPVRPRAALAGA